MNFLQSLFIAAIQGISELFPISSVGHAIIIPQIFHFNFNLNAENLLPFLTCLHLGTALALLIYFRKDWFNLLKSLWTPAQKNDRKLLGLIVIATIPAGILGLLFEKKLGDLFTNVEYVAIFLIINGILLLLGDKLRKKNNLKNLSEITYGSAFLIGLAQSLALLPGISRSGMSLIGGLLTGLNHEAAARFSFLLATPIILAAGLLEVPKMFRPEFHAILFPALTGGIVAGVFAYGTTYILMKYFKKHEVNSLLPFGIYCIFIALISFVI